MGGAAMETLFMGGYYADVPEDSAYCPLQACCWNKWV
jgi:hypothetical protein